MKTRHPLLSTLCAGLLSTSGCATHHHHWAMHVYRVPCRLQSDSNDLNLFIATGSSANPIVTIANNNGYPMIKDFYARPASQYGKSGISVSIRFEAPAHGREISINVLQEGMGPKYEIAPYTHLE